MRKKLHFISLGCVKNLVDSEVMLGKLHTYDISDDIHEADVIIINTCGFIEAAKQESLKHIFDALRDRKQGALLVASGCLSQRYENELREAIPEIDIITGVGDYDKIDAMIEAKKGLMSKNVFLANENHQRVISNATLHAYVKISEGCNQQCSFCAIPSFKGRLKSRSLESVLKEVDNLSKRGYTDISFVAQDSSSYLSDMGIENGLCSLVDSLDGMEYVKSARILYLYPSSTTLNLIEKIAHSRVVQNYFDMPIQHIADPMLKRMRRGTDKAQHKDLLRHMKSIPNAFIRTSIIIGHPHESEAEFEELLEFLEEFEFDRINIFAYSDEEGTRAFFDTQKVDKKTINNRIKRCNKLIQKQYHAQLQSLVGNEIKIALDTAQHDYEYLYRARDMRCAPDIDGEILINENLINDELQSGFYWAKVSEIAGDDAIATLMRKVEC